jgi:pre-rRNA-processing protein TSR3
VDVLILRDPRESAKKCSLTPLRDRPGIRFVAYDRERRLDAGRRILLHPEGDELTAADAEAARGLLVLVCAWRRVGQLLDSVDGDLVHRRLPALRTAYPRRSRVFDDPAQGLASVEALFAALALLGQPRSDLLDGYHWREEFLALNPVLGSL